jgi:hypothetical protein
MMKILIKPFLWFLVFFLLFGWLAWPTLGHAQAPDFQLVLIPDSQYESTLNYMLPHMSTWITTQTTYTNVQMVVAEGDLVDSDVSAQWSNYIGTPTTMFLGPILAANIPYTATIGNHDYCGDGTAGGQPCGLSNTNTGARLDSDFITNIESVIATKSYFKSAWSTDVANYWVAFTVSGHQYGIINLEFCPRPAAVTWASGIMAANSTTEFMINTHAWLYNGTMTPSSTSNYCASSGNDGTGQADSVSNSPATAWNTLKASSNLFAVVNGHYTSPVSTSYAATGTNGNTVAMMDVDYQAVNSGNLVMRVLNISETNNLISAYTFTPYDYSGANLHGFYAYTDAANQFTMSYVPTAFSGSTAATPTFSPTAGAVSNPTTVTASTSTSDGCTMYLDTSNPPTTAQSTYSVTTAVTLYAQAKGCSTYSDSAVSAGQSYTITGPTTWYVNSTGGTRYSTGVTTGQCNGKSAQSYAAAGGTGVNQPCAFGDVRYLWADGSGSGTTFPQWGWVGTGGDTYLIDCPTDCRVGRPGPNSGDWLLAQVDTPPTPINGTSGAHTQIFGLNHAACTSDSDKAHLNGGYGSNTVFDLRGVSYVDLACFNITDHSNCGRASQTNLCATSYPLSDYTNFGIMTNRTTTKTTITDVRVHGTAGAGLFGPTGDGVSVTRVAAVGNASSGWNMDDSTGTTGTGTLTVSYFQILWNGCAEEYPIVDALPYQDCTDDNTGGYGDGIGTATTTSSPAWTMNVDHAIAAYNTQDGFDLLHLTGGGSTLTITNSLAYGNMGQQLKVGAAGTARNNLIVGNCNALRQAIPGTPSGYNSRLTDFCRASDVAVAFAVQDSAITTYQFNTLYSANATGVEIGCNGTCTSLSTIDFRDNLFFGFFNGTANGYPGGGNGNQANQIYLDPVPGVSSLFSNSGSVNSYNATYHAANACPWTAYGDTNAVCLDPQLTDETWHLYGYGNMTPVSGSRVIGAGTTISGVTTDNTGFTRPSPPSMGALEYQGGGSSSNAGMSGNVRMSGNAVIR